MKQGAKDAKNDKKSGMVGKQNTIPLVAENKSLKRELAKTKEQLEEAWSDHKIQAVETVTGLIQEFGHKIFEDAGLDFTSFPSWNEAKINLGIRVEPERNQRQGMRPGYMRPSKNLDLV